MRKYYSFNEDWSFTAPDNRVTSVKLPHTWNAVDGQDGGDNYLRGKCIYERKFEKPEFDEGERIYLEFSGINASGTVFLNGHKIYHHDGGYSTFRVDITEFLANSNLLKIAVSNEKNRKVYPQRADFTFYGGIYRQVQMMIIPEKHFDLDYYGSKGIKVTAKPDGTDGKVCIETFHNALDTDVIIHIQDVNGNVVADGNGTSLNLRIKNVHLWEGIKNPYLYTAVAQLVYNGTVIDEVRTRFGVRSFYVSPKNGFYLNGRKYPLHGVSRHQDRKGLGIAITNEEHDEDMKLIREVGANTIRLAHYQHDQYFYNLCDEYGMVVWAEIPYISEHMPQGNENTQSQMKELIVQNYNHPSIFFWGISNEITIKEKYRKDMMKNHKELNELCHRLDPTRITTLANYAMCPMFHRIVHEGSDVTGYNLYLGWYVPGLWLNDLFIKAFHTLYPKRRLSYSEYGAEGMPNLHTSRPKRGDHTEEYQCKYHEYMLKFFDRYPFLWSTYVWNMFDFAADARDQGGEPGMNHKGLITFDRKMKKDSFYLYKSWWSNEPFIHLCGKRYVNRVDKIASIKVYTNLSKVELYQNGKLVEKKSGQRIYEFKLRLEKENNIIVRSGNLQDTMIIKKVKERDSKYKLKKGNSKDWV